MLEALSSIDPDALDRLLDLRRRQRVLEERLAKVDDLRTQVSPQVYERVSADYRRRAESLEADAAPLDEALRGDAKGLADALDAARGEVRDLELDLEETTLRRELGEYDDDEFESRRATLTERLATRRDEVDEAEALQARLLEALGEAPGGEAPGARSDADATDASDTETEEDEGDEGHEGDEGAHNEDPEPDTDEPETDEPETDEPDTDERDADEPDADERDRATETGADDDLHTEWVDDATNEVPTNEVPTNEVPTNEVPTNEVPPDPRSRQPTQPGVPLPDVPSAPPTPSEAPTVLSTTPPELPTGARTQRLSTDSFEAPPAMLVFRDEGGVMQRFPLRLAPMTIGRTADNDICIAGLTVSRRHARVERDGEGYRIIDLGSENGLFINGKSVREHRLAPGDEIHIGSADKTLVFEVLPPS